MNYKILTIILISLLLISLGAWIGYSIHPNPQPQQSTHIDSTEVVNLRHQITELTNQLKAKPKVIYVQGPAIPGQPYPVPDTMTVYPLGSYQLTDTVPFSIPMDKDRLSLDVLINTYHTVYTDRTSKFYHEDSLSVQLKDINYIKAPDITSKPKTRILDLIVGVTATASYDKTTQHLKPDIFGIDIGFRFFNTYDISASGYSNMTFGIRIGRRI